MLILRQPSKRHPGVIGRREHNDMCDNHSLLDEPADNLGLRSIRDLSLVRADEQRPFGFLPQALGKRPPTKRRNLRIIRFLQIREALGPDCELLEFSHTKSIWHTKQKANGNHGKYSF